MVDVFIDRMYISMSRTRESSEEVFKVYQDRSTNIELVFYVMHENRERRTATRMSRN